MSSADFAMEHIRSHYNMPWLQKGIKVNQFEGKTGVVTGAQGTYVKIKLDGETTSCPYNPTWEITYLDQDNNVIADYKQTIATL